jgi:hypothetical protein
LFAFPQPDRRAESAPKLLGRAAAAVQTADEALVRAVFERHLARLGQAFARCQVGKSELVDLVEALVQDLAAAFAGDLFATERKKPPIAIWVFGDFNPGTTRPFFGWTPTRDPSPPVARSGGECGGD